MSNFYKPAGTYELVSCYIKPYNDTTNRGYDMKAIIHTFSITESMLSGHVSGSIKVVEAVGMLYDLPLRGEEIIEITYRDFKEVEHTDKFFVYSISGVQPAKVHDSKMIEYTLNVVSIGKFVSHRRRVREAYNEEISTSVELLFNQYYIEDNLGTDKQLEIFETTGPQTLVIPNMRPEEAMMLFARKAYNADSPSSTYVFFENRQKYKFDTYENISLWDGSSGEIPIYFIDDMPDNSPEGQLYLMQNIISIDFGEIVNTFRDINRGAWYRILTELDYLNRREINTTYEHLAETQNYFYPHGSGASDVGYRHTTDFINTHLNYAENRLVLKDYIDVDAQMAPGMRPHTFYPETYNRKNTNFYHYADSKVNVKIYGSNEIFAGSLIALNIPKYREVEELDEEHSGIYLVETVVNEFIEGVYYQSLTLVRGALAGDGVVETPKGNYQGVVDGETSTSTVFSAINTTTATNTSDDGRVNLTRAEASAILKGPEADNARASAEKYLGRPMTDDEWDNLLAATVAESSPNNPKEQAYIMGVILNRARNNYGGDSNIVSILNQPYQFQAVTGTRTNGFAASSNFTNPAETQMASTINGVNEYLSTVPTDYVNFTAANPDAYGPGTNVGFIDDVASSEGSTTIGGTIFGNVK
jgi:hypothetical protein